MMRRKRRKLQWNTQIVYSNYQQKQVMKINCGFLSGIIFTIVHFHIPLWKKFTILQASTTLQGLCFDFLFLVQDFQSTKIVGLISNFIQKLFRSDEKGTN